MQQRTIANGILSGSLGVLKIVNNQTWITDGFIHGI
jgi:hypothetical protein